MNIMMIASECQPFSKTGGLADVAYALSEKYVEKGENVFVVTPLYRKFDYKRWDIKKVYEFSVKMNWRNIDTKVFHLTYNDIEFYFIQNDYYFNGREGGLYGYFDDGERYAYFINASLELIKLLPFKIDVAHVHDWQAAILPCILKNKYSNDPYLSKIKTVLTIHNPLFKGFLDRGSLSDLFDLSLDLFDRGDVRLDNQVSTLKAGIKFADKITTVSPTHAEELMTKEGSKGLDYDLTLRKDDFVGILNGMDQGEFNPEKDKAIYQTYSFKDFEENKKKNKIEYCKEHNLNPDLPLFAVVSRLTDQKGLDLMYAMADFIAHEGGSFTVLGSGEAYAEEMFNSLYRRCPNNVAVYIGYSDELAHKLYAASDFFIMPSAFEPCGLGQMIAQRYGSLPLVRRTGGLKDSVICYDNELKNEDTANGFGFDDYNICEALKCTAAALNVYNLNKEVMKKLVKNALLTNNSWDESADKYLALYSSIKK